MPRCLLICLVWGLANLFLQSTGTCAEMEDAKLERFFKQYLEEEFRERPISASRLGDHRFDHLVDDLSAAARERWKERDQKTLKELDRQVDYQKLSRSSQIDCEILQHHLKRSLWLAANTKPFEQDPRIYNEYISDSVFLLLTQSTLPRATNVKNCVARMTAIPKIIAAARESLANPPRVFCETAIKQNRGAIGFYEHGIFELAGETPQLSDLGPAAQQAAAHLKEYQQFLEKELLPRATGPWRLGKEKFEQKLELELDAGVNAAKVVEEATREAERVEREMVTIARQLWSQAFPKQPLPPDDADGRRALVASVLAHFNRQHGSAQELVANAGATVATIKKFISEHDILHLPEPDRCRVMEMPEFQRGNAVAYLNPAPPLDTRAASVYAISPPPREWDAAKVSSYLEEYNQRMIQILTIHEAYPGHYVQLEYSNRHPSLLRKILSSGVFAEGWAVYTEQMMLDQGYGGGDLVLRLNQLKWYLRSVANAILDYNMHCTDMSDEAALAFLTKRAFQSEGEALGKIIRAKQSSCQLSTYFVGRMAFYRLRQEVQRKCGDQFSLGRFHEAVLSHGTLPVKYLPELMKATR